jgi:hypothetical protein
MRSAAVLAAAVLLGTPVARAEYAELGMAKEYGTYTLLGFGTASLVLDGVSISYLRRGAGPENGRRVVAVLQLVDAAFLAASAGTWYRLGKSSRQGPDSSLYIMTGTHLALAATSVGLGIATYLTRSDEPLLGHLSTVSVAPLASAATGTDGLALMVAGRF